MVVLVPTKNLNPEDKYYYQMDEDGTSYNEYRGLRPSDIIDKEDTRPMVNKECDPLSLEEVTSKLTAF